MHCKLLVYKRVVLCSYFHIVEIHIDIGIDLEIFHFKIKNWVGLQF